MRVISKRTLREFWTKHRDVEQALRAWHDETTVAVWKSPADIKRDYPSASIVGDNRVVFNIKGNNYRLVVRINYSYTVVWVRFVGTHAAYDRINAKII